MDDAEEGLAMAHDTEPTRSSQSTRMRAGQPCIVCDRPITGQGVLVPQFSASGARPDNWRHATCYARR